MTTYRQRVGRMGEALARTHLEKIGYSVLHDNYRGKSGEIDLVARKDGVLVFVEVRTRKARGFGTPEESITQAKRDRMVALAHEYVQAHPADHSEWRIDVVAIELGRTGAPSRVEVIENAVEG